MSNFDYYTKAISDKQRYLLDVKNNIITERVWLFSDFCTTISYSVVKFYVGYEELQKLEDQEKHFYFSLDKVIEIYRKEGYGINLNVNMKLYLFNHFHKTFYSVVDDNENLEFFRQMALAGLKRAFNMVEPKTMNAYEQFVSLYRGFNENFYTLTIDTNA